MEPSVVVRDDPLKQWSKGKQASDSQLHGKKAVAISTWTNWLETGPLNLIWQTNFIYPYMKANPAINSNFQFY